MSYVIYHRALTPLLFIVLLMSKRLIPKVCYIIRQLFPPFFVSPPNLHILFWLQCYVWSRSFKILHSFRCGYFFFCHVHQTEFWLTQFTIIWSSYLYIAMFVALSSFLSYHLLFVTFFFLSGPVASPGALKPLVGDGAYIVQLVAGPPFFFIFFISSFHLHLFLVCNKINKSTVAKSSTIIFFLSFLYRLAGDTKTDSSLALFSRLTVDSQ